MKIGTNNATCQNGAENDNNVRQVPNDFFVLSG
jgi:hypothetical protein